MTSTRHRSKPALLPRPGDLKDSPGDLEDSPVEREDLRRLVSPALDALDTVEVAPPADEVLPELAIAATARCC